MIATIYKYAKLSWDNGGFVILGDFCFIDNQGVGYLIYGSKRKDRTKGQYFFFDDITSIEKLSEEWVLNMYFNEVLDIVPYGKEKAFDLWVEYDV